MRLENKTGDEPKKKGDGAPVPEDRRQRAGFEYLEGPVTPKPEKIPQPHAEPKRRSASPRRSKSSGPKGGGDKPPHRGSVPKVPLVKV